MTLTEAREYIANWICEEYDQEDADLGDDNTKIAIAFSEFKEHKDDPLVFEQWYANLLDMELYCELNDEVCIIQKFQSLDELVDSLDFDWLIGEADEYVRTHAEYFKEN